MTQSTVDPLIPVTDSDLESEPIRNNFLACYNDINYIYELIDNIGNGSIATQNFDNVTITGGTINGTTIGASVPSLGYFTDLSFTGSFTTPVNFFEYEDIQQVSTQALLGNPTPGSANISEINLDPTLSFTGQYIGVVNNTSTQRGIVSKGGVTAGTRQQINFIEGSGVTVTALDNAGTDSVDVTIAASAAGTVTSVSVVSANGLAGSVATATSTPAITLSTTITGILQGNGTAISAASTTGSGEVVLANTPTLITPNIGVATGTSLDVSGVIESGTNAGTGGRLKLFGATSGDATIRVAAAAGTATIFELPADNGTAGYLLETDGNGVTSWVAAAGSGTVTDVSVVSANGFAGSVATSTTTPAITLTTTITGILSGNGTAISAASTTGSGSVVLATSPTLVTPALGTPSSGTLTNTTGFPAANLAGLGTGVATWLATPSSANLRSAVTDETGTGALVFAGSPVLTTPDLGTPSAVTLTNGTGLPISTGVSGLGSNVATFLATPSSANLAAAVSDETGTGALVFANTPTLVTPNIGAATGTSLDVSGVLESGANGGTGGQVKMFGATSGDVTLKVAAAAGTATVFQLPADNGTDTYVLQTDGNGVTSWVASSGGGTIGGSTGGTDNAILRADGTGGSTLQTSPVTIADTTGVIAGTQGVTFTGSSSGTTALVPTAAASGTITMPATTGTMTVLGNTTTGSGSIVLDTSPTLVTPALGTPSAIVLTNATGTASGLTAGAASTVATSNEAADTTCFLAFFTASGTQTLEPKNNTGLTYNSSTNAVGATTFTGALTGNASTATALATARAIGGVNFDGTAAIVPQTIESANEATDTTCFPLFITASGTQQLQPKNNTSLTFNSNTGALGATSFSGAGTGLTGTASSLTAGIASTVSTSNEASDTTCFPLFITASGTQQLQPKNNTSLTFNASTANLGCTTFTGALVGNADTATKAGIPQNSQSAAYTTVASDANSHILHPTADNNARTFTIAANASVAYAIGTSITFVNQINTVTIAINSDTLVLAGAGTTGSRTLAANGMATAIKIASTTWFISGTGLT